MNLRSVGLQTDVELAASRGVVVDRGGYLVVSTDDPTYYYGNMLVLPAAPQVGEVGYWSRTFAQEEALGGDPAIRHVTFKWDGITGDVGAADELRAAGFTVEVTQVLTARTVSAPSIPVEIRALATTEVMQTVELEYRDADRHDDIYRQFLQRRAVWKQSLVATGRAMWFGAFDAGELVGSLGLVALGSRARYQDVQTAATHRKRGIAAALLAAAAREVLPAIHELVIVAEPGSAAARVYERVGFRPTELTASACKYPKLGT
jgi:GNAT superfamily N-acetyltransferase